MKKLLSIFLILISFVGFSQNMEIPEIDWQGNMKTENVYVDLLNLKDRNSLIIKISYLTNELYANYIIYQNDGKVKRFEVYHPVEPGTKTKVKRKRIKKSDYHHYWNYLNKCVNENKFDINKSKLNITHKKGKEVGTMETITISHGAKYGFEICQGKNYIAYGSDFPKTYIQSKFPGYKERQKLVDLMNGFEELIEKY